MQSAQPPLVDLTVLDADFQPSDHPCINTIFVFYEDDREAPVDGERPMHTVPMCGHAFVNYLRNVVGHRIDCLKTFWESTRPKKRDKLVEECLEYRANIA